MTPNSVQAWRNKLQAGLVVAICALALLFAAFLAFAAWRNGTAISAYDSAPACRSAPDAIGSDQCRYQADANVISTSRASLLAAVVSFDQMPGRTFSTRFASNNEPARGALVAGGRAPATLWDGKVTRLAEVPTVDDPHNSLTGTNLIIAGFLALLSIPGLVAGGFMARAAWRPIAHQGGAA